MPARLVLFICLMLLVGMPVALQAIALPVLARASLSATHLAAQVRRIEAIALLGLIAGAILMLYAQVIPLELDYTFAEWQVFVTHTTIGQMMFVRVGLGIVGLVLMRLLQRSALWMWACVLIGLLGQASITRTSHTYAMGSNVLSVASDFAHLLGGGLWVGGLIVMGLGLAIVMQAKNDTQLPQHTALLIRRFAPLGIIGVALVVGTGLLLTPLHIAQADTLVNSLYGLILTCKILATLLAVALAGLHKFVTQRNIHGKKDVQRFAFTLQMEIIIVLMVFVGAALLTSAPPPEHQMTSDMPHQMLAETNSPFQSLLRIGALGIGLFGLGALVLEWRKQN